MLDLVIFAHNLLTAKGQNVNTVDSNGMTALMWAAYRTSSIDPVRLLVTLGSSFTATDHLQGNTALHWAARRKNTDIIKLLAGTYKQVPQSADVLFIRTYCQASESAHTQNTRTR